MSSFFPRGGTTSPSIAMSCSRSPTTRLIRRSAKAPMPSRASSCRSRRSNPRGFAARSSAVEFPVSFGECVSQLDELDVELLGRAPQDVEGVVGRDSAAVHQDSLCLADHVAAVDGLLELLLPERGS